MKRSQLLIVVAAAVAVAAVAILSGGGDEEDGGGGSGATPAAGALRISFAYSPEKEKLLEPLIADFNERGEEVGGRPVFVEGEVVSSGEAQARIADERLKPVAWSPASSLWARLLNFEADRALAPEDNPSIVRTPLVIAMWEEFARDLGWPRARIGWNRILRLARTNAPFGRPEFGRFKLVHTNPDFSTSGLSAVVAEYYAATGKREGLTEADVTTSEAREIVRDIERSIVHYGDTTLFIAEQMKKEGPGYASAVAMEEVTLLDFNRTRGSQQRLVALYPPEGTFYSDNPFVILDAAWVSPREREGAAAFQRFLAEEVDPELAARYGFRPADLDADPVPPITEANGADPAQPERTLGLPDPRVLNRIKASWREDRKPSNILLVVDTSGSMADAGRLDRAKEGLRSFFREVSPNDRVGLLTFSDRLQYLVPIAPFAQSRGTLETTVGNLIADGGTAFFDAAAEGVGAVRDLDDSKRINAVVLLTDGEDTDSSRSVEQVVELLRGQGESANRVRVFTIAYSAQAEGAEQALQAISAASGGQAYTGDTDDIETVYRSISSFF